VRWTTKAVAMSAKEATKPEVGRAAALSKVVASTAASSVVTVVTVAVAAAKAT
jgi:hypothetical protein